MLSSQVCYVLSLIYIMYRLKLFYIFRQVNEMILYQCKKIKDDGSTTPYYFSQYLMNFVFCKLIYIIGNYHQLTFYFYCLKNFRIQLKNCEPNYDTRIKERQMNELRPHSNESHLGDRITKKGLKEIKVTIYTNKVHLLFL